MLVMTEEAEEEEEKKWTRRRFLKKKRNQGGERKGKTVGAGNTGTRYRWQAGRSTAEEPPRWAPHPGL